MPRQQPVTESEDEEMREAIDRFTERVAEAYGDAVTARPVPGGENGDIEVRLNTRKFPTEAEGPLDFSELFAAAIDLGFEPTTGVGYTIADVGSANESSRVFLTFAYTWG